MKRFWVVMLSLGLIAAFAMPAAAVDVKVSGQYYVRGFIADNPSLLDKSTQAATDPSWATNANRSGAKLIDQRLRVNAEFKVQEGLKLVTRFDALENMWGSTVWSGWNNPATMQQTEGRSSTGAAGATASQNINFSRVYMDITTGIGQFLVGYQNFTSWGNNWVTSNNTYPGIKYIGKWGNFTGVLAIEKRQEVALDLYQGGAAGNPAIGRGMDSDKEVYDAGFIYAFNKGQAGFIWQQLRNPNAKFTAAQEGTPQKGYVSSLSVLIPTAKVAFGNFDLMLDGIYIFGKLRKYEPNSAGVVTNQDVDANQLGGQINAKYTWKPVSVGGKFAYVSGDDMQDATKVTGSLMHALNGNRTKNDCLILWNSDYVDAMGPMFGNTTVANANPRTGATYYNSYYMDNVWFYQLYADVTPMAKMNIHAAVSYATADKKPKSGVGPDNGTTVQEFVSDKYGTEFDLTLSYKIFDNLEYMVGGGYLWVGDYFKGYNNDAKTKDNYLLTHKLTLTF